MLSESGALRARTGAAVAVPVLVGLILATLWVLDQRSQARTQVDSEVRATVASSVTVVRTDLRNQLEAAVTGSQPGSRLVSVAGLGTAKISASAAVTARDSGEATLDDGAQPPSIIVPLYRGGVTPTNTEQRRRDISRYRIVPLNMAPVLSQLVPDVGGLSLLGPTRLIASDPAPAPAGASRFAVDMDLSGSPGWVVQAWHPDPGVPAAGWFGALVLILAAIGGGVLASRLVQREYRADARWRLLEQDRSIITGLAPVLQTSLEIGEVLPRVSAHLVDNLRLSGLSLSIPVEGGERQLFVWGTVPDIGTRPQPGNTAKLLRGQTFAVELTRGGRALGLLRVVAGEPIGADQMLSLATAGEMLGSTLANAEAFAQQQEVLSRMRSVDELKTVFLATASHELRTPVTAIVGFTTLLLDQWQSAPPERARALVERVQANGQRLDALIEQLLDFSRVERGLPQANDELLDLGATVRQILDDQAELVAGHTLDILVESDCFVRGSRASIERVLINLVGNAAKYSPTNTRITVTIRPEHEDKVALLVDDEGAGVAEADRERVFSRFYRGRTDAVTRTRGAGIGLAIVAEYAAAMSAAVDVSSAPGGGARFRVAFPVVSLLSPTAFEGRHDVVVS